MGAIADDVDEVGVDDDAVSVCEVVAVADADVDVDDVDDVDDVVAAFANDATIRASVSSPTFVRKSVGA